MQYSRISALRPPEPLLTPSVGSSPCIGHWTLGGLLPVFGQHGVVPICYIYTMPSLLLPCILYLPPYHIAVHSHDPAQTAPSSLFSRLAYSFCISLTQPVIYSPSRRISCSEALEATTRSAARWPCSYSTYSAQSSSSAWQEPILKTDNRVHWLQDPHSIWKRRRCFWQLASSCCLFPHSHAVSPWA